MRDKINDIVHSNILLFNQNIHHQIISQKATDEILIEMNKQMMYILVFAETIIIQLKHRKQLDETGYEAAMKAFESMEVKIKGKTK
jgi:hypothetical protein